MKVFDSVLDLIGNGTICQANSVVVTKTCDIEAAMKKLKHDNRLYRGIHTPLEDNEFEACNVPVNKIPETINNVTR